MDLLKKILAIVLAIVVLIVGLKLVFFVAGIAFKIVIALDVVCIVVAIANWIYTKFFRK